MARWMRVAGLLGSLASAGCQARPDVPASCSSAVCVGGEVELKMATATPALGEAGRVVLVEEGGGGTALVGLVGQDGERRLLGLAMVAVSELSGSEVVVPASEQLGFGKALLWVIEGDRRRPLPAGELRFSLDPQARKLKATLTAPELHAEVDGRYRLECKVPESVLNVQIRGVAAPGSETYTGDQGMDSDFCRRFRSLR